MWNFLTLFSLFWSCTENSAVRFITMVSCLFSMLINGYNATSKATLWTREYAWMSDERIHKSSVESGMLYIYNNWGDEWNVKCVCKCDGFLWNVVSTIATSALAIEVLYFTISIFPSFIIILLHYVSDVSFTIHQRNVHMVTSTKLHLETRMTYIKKWLYHLYLRRISWLKRYWGTICKQSQTFSKLKCTWNQQTISLYMLYSKTWYKFHVFTINWDS